MGNCVSRRSKYQHLSSPEEKYGLVLSSLAAKERDITSFERDLEASNLQGDRAANEALLAAEQLKDVLQHCHEIETESKARVATLQAEHKAAMAEQKLLHATASGSDSMEREQLSERLNDKTKENFALIGRLQTREQDLRDATSELQLLRRTAEIQTESIRKLSMEVSGANTATTKHLTASQRTIASQLTSLNAVAQDIAEMKIIFERLPKSSAAVKAEPQGWSSKGIDYSRFARFAHPNSSDLRVAFQGYGSNLVVDVREFSAATGQYLKSRGICLSLLDAKELSRVLPEIVRQAQVTGGANL